MTTVQQTRPAFPSARQAIRTRRRTRAAAVAGAVLATSAVWATAHAAGVGFLLTDSNGSGTISLPVTIAFTAVFGLLGWASLAALEHYVRRPTGTWTVLAGVVTLLSLVPVFLEDATAGTKASLTVIHLVVAAVLIPAFRLGAPQRS
jgi:hypothetical protein